MHIGIAAALLVLVLSRSVFAACPVERGPVKTVTDAHASQVRLVPMPATIESLHAIPAPPRPLPHDSRIAPVETTIYSVTATLIAFRLTPQAEIQLILSDDRQRVSVARTSKAVAPATAACADVREYLDSSAT